MLNNEEFFSKTEAFGNSAIILLRSIELKLVKKHILDGLKAKRVLDLGCGDGLAAGMVLERPVTYGLDKNADFIQKAKKSGVYQETILGDAGEIPLDKDICDMVFSNCVIEHIKKLDPVFEEVSRILRKNGLFVFTTLTDNFGKYSFFSWLNIRPLGRLEKLYTKMREKKLQHYHGYSFEEWSRLLARHGFEVVDCYYYLDKKTAELWDFFLLLSFFLAKISPRLDFWVYRVFLKNLVSRKFMEAQTVGEKGAAIGILAKKI